MSKEYSLEARGSYLQRYVGMRVNLFRVMNDARFFLADDYTVIATRIDDFALTACVSFDPISSYYYIRDCGWYRSDLSSSEDEDVPEHIQEELLHQLTDVLG